MKKKEKRCDWVQVSKTKADTCSFYSIWQNLNEPRQIYENWKRSLAAPKKQKSRPPLFIKWIFESFNWLLCSFVWMFLFFWMSIIVGEMKLSNKNAQESFSGWINRFAKNKQTNTGWVLAVTVGITRHYNLVIYDSIFQITSHR